MGNRHINAINHGSFQSFQQHVEQFNLLRGQFLGYKIRYYIQPATQAEQPGRRQEILLGGGRKQQPASVFVDPQHHQGSLLRGQVQAMFHQKAGQYG